MEKSAIYHESPCSLEVGRLPTVRGVTFQASRNGTCLRPEPKFIMK